MSSIFRNFFRNFSLNQIFRTSRMDSEDDLLYYSHQKLSQLIQQKGDRNAAIKDYLENLNYQPIKDFTKGLEWFNVSEPLSFAKHLKGKIVVLDFFTYCCINCMHIIPDLRAIEQEFSVEDGLVVIGVHSAKFENEKQSSNILAAVQRYNITHPVVNDYNSEIWQNCDVHCWPTLLILGPNANPIVMLMGEGHKENLQLYIKCSLEFYKSKNQISNHKLPLKSAYHLLPDMKGPLLFPGKITNFPGQNHELLAISDSGNNRILVVTADGLIQHQIGCGKIGLKDGNFDECQFNSPQGLVFQNDSILYVADTENHAIRRVDLQRKIVETIAGNGVQGHDRIGGKLWQQQEISSPWDVCVYQTPDMDMTFYPDGSNPPLRNVLIVAMAGTHQIWALFLEDTVWWKCKKYKAGTCICIAGSGREENRNNLYPHNSAFAQPSGLALCKKHKEIYIADSESSSIRRLSLVDGKVTPVVGGDKNPQNLFAFGDKDGTLFEAKLQHSLGLAVSKDESYVFVADTYNHKLKIINIAQNIIKTLTPATFNEPGGLCAGVSGDRLYIADTNDHCVKIVTLNRQNSVISVDKLDLIQPKIVTKTGPISNLPIIDLKPISLNCKGGKLICNVHFQFKDGLKLSIDAPQKWYVSLPNATWSCVPHSGTDIDDIDVVISVPSTENSSIDFVFNIVTCTEDSCLPKNFVARLPIVGKDLAEISVMNCIKIELTPKNVTVL